MGDDDGDTSCHGIMFLDSLANLERRYQGKFDRDYKKIASVLDPIPGVKVAVFTREKRERNGVKVKNGLKKLNRCDKVNCLIGIAQVDRWTVRLGWI